MADQSINDGAVNAPVGYPCLNLGLNNQKMALFGLFNRARFLGRPLILPHFSIYDPVTTAASEVPLSEVYAKHSLFRFAKAFEVEIAEGDPIEETNGWDCFCEGATHIGNAARRGIAAVNDFTAQFFAHLVPNIIFSEVFSALSRRVFEELNTKIVAQLRIEKDWMEYRRVETASFNDIMEKIRNDLSGNGRLVYVACDESNLPVGKEEIRSQVRVNHGLDLIWKSDLLAREHLESLSILDLSILDFEMGLRASSFVGTSHSTFSNMVAFEAVCRNRKAVDSHYIYDLPGRHLGRRTDFGAEAFPDRAIDKLLLRELLIPTTPDECVWPVCLTAHIGHFGDISSEGSVLFGVPGGPLVCGIRDSKGRHIQGFSIQSDRQLPWTIEYRALLDDGTWSSWERNGAFVGTRGQSRSLHGYSARLAGPHSQRFDVICVGSFTETAQLVTAMSGDACSAGAGKKLEAMQIVFRPVTGMWNCSPRPEGACRPPPPW